MITTNSISIVIGSWGSYNESNERALGSKWLDLSLYSDWEEIEEELTAQGFELDGIDEELFIQDVDNFRVMLTGITCIRKISLSCYKKPVFLMMITETELWRLT